jgi:hypothetical protein
VLRKLQAAGVALQETQQPRVPPTYDGRVVTPSGAEMSRCYVPLLIAAAALVATLTAPPIAAAQSPPACNTPAHGEFDFWIGTWNVRWTNADKTSGQGSNRVRKTHDGCVVLEEFDGSPGSPLKGTSMSVFDRQTKLWRQTWVDNTGAYLAFEGGTSGEGADRRMALTRRATVGGKPMLQRMVFRDITQDALTWDWQRSDDEGKTWATTWQIRYERQK